MAVIFVHTLWSRDQRWESGMCFFDLPRDQVSKDTAKQEEENEQVVNLRIMMSVFWWEKCILVEASWDPEDSGCPLLCFRRVKVFVSEICSVSNMKISSTNPMVAVCSLPRRNFVTVHVGQLPLLWRQLRSLPRIFVDVVGSLAWNPDFLSAPSSALCVCWRTIEPL